MLACRGSQHYPREPSPSLVRRDGRYLMIMSSDNNGRTPSNRLDIFRALVCLGRDPSRPCIARALKTTRFSSIWISKPDNLSRLTFLHDVDIRPAFCIICRPIIRHEDICPRGPRDTLIFGIIIRDFFLRIIVTKGCLFPASFNFCQTIGLRHIQDSGEDKMDFVFSLDALVKHEASDHRCAFWLICQGICGCMFMPGNHAPPEISIYSECLSTSDDAWFRRSHFFVRQLVSQCHASHASQVDPDNVPVVCSGMISIQE